MPNSSQNLKDTLRRMGFLQTQREFLQRACRVFLVKGRLVQTGLISLQLQLNDSKSCLPCRSRKMQRRILEFDVKYRQLKGLSTSMRTICGIRRTEGVLPCRYSANSKE